MALIYNGLTGFPNFAVARLIDIIQYLVEVREESNKIYQNLNAYKQEVEENREKLDEPDDILNYIDHFLKIVENYSNEIKRLSLELKSSVKKEHVISFEQLYDDCINVNEYYCKGFKSEHINRKLKDEELRYLVDMIHSNTSGLMYSFRNFGQIKKRLEALVGTKTVPYDNNDKTNIELKKTIRTSTKIKVPWINGKKLMEIWDIDLDGLYQCLFDLDLPVYDKNYNEKVFAEPEERTITDESGNVIDEFLVENDLYTLWTLKNYEYWPYMEGESIEAILCSLYFKMEDIKQFEEKYGKSKLTDSDKKKLRPNQLAKEKCREVAKELWEKHHIRSKEMAGRPEVIEVAGEYTLETRRRWIHDLAPSELQKPGRPPKK